MVFSRSFRPWSLPSAVLLAALVVWGVLRYPHLPGRLPQHVGADGVDAWTDRTVGSAFVLVFLYAGLTVVMLASAELTLRMTPRDELPAGGGPTSAGRPAPAPLLNRPASRASARRTARAMLALNACMGVSFLAGCGVLWHSAPGREVPGWLLAAVIAPLLAGAAVTVAAAVGDRRRASP